jgi:hypothetical protein
MNNFKEREFVVGVDIHVIHHIEYKVKATSVEEAAQLVSDGCGEPIHPELEVSGDEFDIRYVVDSETGEETEF